MSMVLTNSNKRESVNKYSSIAKGNGTTNAPLSYARVLEISTSKYSKNINQNIGTPSISPKRNTNKLRNGGLNAKLYNAYRITSNYKNNKNNRSLHEAHNKSLDHANESETKTNHSTLSIKNNKKESISNTTDNVKSIAIKYKTELCINWMNTGSCVYGSKCHFGHGPNDLRAHKRVRNFKTQMCCDPARDGSKLCMFASRCNYLHPSEALRRAEPDAYFDDDYFSNLDKQYPNTNSKNILQTLSKFEKYLNNSKINTFKKFYNITAKNIIITPVDINMDPNLIKYSSNYKVKTISGNYWLRIEEYINYIKLIKPNIFIPISDIAPLVNGCSRNRCKKSVMRTVDLLDKQLNYVKNSEIKDIKIYAAIQGGDDIEQRIRCCMEVVERNVDGYVISGICIGEKRSKTLEIVKVIIDNLPMSGNIMAEKVNDIFIFLKIIQLGIRIFDSSYSMNLTKKGLAMTFDYKDMNNLKSDMIIDLYSESFKGDNKPIKEECLCFTCKNHSKAYLYHLLKVKEMNGELLLHMHNSYYFNEFLKMVEEYMNNRSFDSFCEQFIKRYDKNYNLL